MNSSSKYNFPNAKNVRVFESVDTYVENQTSSLSSSAISASEVAEIFEGLHIITCILERLYQKNILPKSEAEAIEIIEAEFSEIEKAEPNKITQLRTQVLNRERWFNGGKAALSEVAKHYLEEHVFAKAFLAFLDGFSADEDDYA